MQNLDRIKSQLVKHILVVDDEEDTDVLVRQRFRHHIHSGDWEFLFARDGLQAIEALKVHPIDVVVTDIHMPMMDGLTLLEKIPLYSCGTRSVILSAYDDIPNLRKAMNRGAFDFLAKPLNLKELESVLENAFEPRQPCSCHKKNQ